MGFTSEALKKIAPQLSSDQARAWEVWDEPPPSLTDSVIAFRLLFLASELAVRPDKRTPKEWKNVIYLEAAPPGKVTVVTLFVTVGDPDLRHESEPSFRLASLDIDGRRRAQLVVHSDDEGNLPDLVESSVAQARKQAESKGVKIPKDAYSYFLGRQNDGCRFLIGARVNRIGSHSAV